jgi:hypothetical protein
MQPISNNPGRNCPPRQLKPFRNANGNNNPDHSGANSGLGLPTQFISGENGSSSNGPTIINIFQLNQINQSQLFSFGNEPGGTGGLGSSNLGVTNPTGSNSGMPNSQGLIGLLGLQSDPNGNISNNPLSSNPFGPSNGAVTAHPQNQFMVMPPASTGNSQLDPQTGQMITQPVVSPQTGNPQVATPQGNMPQNTGNVPGSGEVPPNTAEMQNQQILLQQLQQQQQAEAQLEQQLTAICVMLIQLIQQMVMKLVGGGEGTQPGGGSGPNGGTEDPHGTSGRRQVPWVDPDNNAFDDSDAIYDPDHTVLRPKKDDDDEMM